MEQFKCLTITYIVIIRKFKQWWSSIPPIPTKRTFTSHLNCDVLSK